MKKAEKIIKALEERIAGAERYRDLELKNGHGGKELRIRLDRMDWQINGMKEALYAAQDALKDV